MKKNRKWIWLIVLGLVMVGLIPLTVHLTGGREIEEFTSRDQVIFWCFLGAEILTVIALFIVADKIGKKNLEENPAQQQMLEQKPTKTERIIKRRSIFLQAIAIALVLLAHFVGVFVGRSLSEQQKQALIVPMLCLLGAVLLLGVLSVVLRKVFQARLQHMDVAQLQEWIQSHREQAEQAAAQKLLTVKRVRIGTGLYAVLILMIGLALAFLSGCRQRDGTLPLLLSAGIAILGITRFRFPTPVSVIEENDCWIKEEEFPTLYALARRAARANGRKADVRIALTGGCNAGIGKLGAVDLIQLGAVLIGLLSEEELYTVLLHEYGHAENAGAQREADYYDWLQNGRDRHFLKYISPFLFCFADDYYELQYGLYRFANSIGEETRADRSMAELGDPQIAASSLLKLKYEELFNWEQEGQDRPEQKNLADLAHSMVRGHIEEVKAAVPERVGVYNRLIGQEIQARSASHPVMRQRLETLGVRDYTLVPAKDSEAYREEVEKAVETAEKNILENGDPEDYAAYRGRLLDRVEAWEQAGRPLQPEEYPDTVGALKELGRLSEAMELCDRAITELPADASAAYAEFMKGCCLLHRWDPAGIDLIYSAIETNNNYLNEGLDQIGSFCCATGNQGELERYRSAAVELMQQDKDLYSQIGVLKKGDKLSAETLPEELAERIRASLEEIDDGQIREIYLLHKQLSPDFSTSPMVVRFREGTEPDMKSDTMHRVFLCLDAVENWQFSLFEYDEVKKLKPEEIAGESFYNGKAGRENH